MMKAKRRCRICEQQPTTLIEYTWRTGDHSGRISSERCDAHYAELLAVRDAGRIGVTIHGVAPVVFGG